MHALTAARRSGWSWPYRGTAAQSRALRPVAAGVSTMMRVACISRARARMPLARSFELRGEVVAVVGWMLPARDVAAVVRAVVVDQPIRCSLSRGRKLRDLHVVASAVKHTGMGDPLCGRQHEARAAGAPGRTPSAPASRWSSIEAARGDPRACSTQPLAAASMRSACCSVIMVWFPRLRRWLSGDGWMLV